MYLDVVHVVLFALHLLFLFLLIYFLYPTIKYKARIKAFCKFLKYKINFYKEAKVRYKYEMASFVFLKKTSGYRSPSLYYGIFLSELLSMIVFIIPIPEILPMSLTL